MYIRNERYTNKDIINFILEEFTFSLKINLGKCYESRFFFTSITTLKSI